MKVNSEGYWNDRFAGDWEEQHGREQTRFFARLALRELPPAIAEDIRERGLSICDYGCALGDAVAELAKAFPGSKVGGVDFAQAAVDRARATYPAHEFERASSPREIPPADVVFCSNTLEHFADPMSLLADLAAAARRYLLVLVPSHEQELISEHLARFDFSSFPLRVGALQLAGCREFDTSREEPSYWPGRQILVVYAHPEAGAIERLRLGDLTSTLERDRAELAADGAALRQELAELRRRAEAERAAAARAAAAQRELEAQAAKLRAEADELRATLASSEATRQDKQRQLDAANEALTGIRESDFWRVASRYYRWRDGSVVFRGAHRALKAARKLAQGDVAGAQAAVTSATSAGAPASAPASDSRLPRRAGPPPHAGVRMVKPIAVKVVNTDFSPADASQPFSLVTTVKNEAANIVDFLRSIERQDVLPDEVIVVDGGSSDGTPDRVAEFAASSKLRLQLVEAPGANIAAGRNVGIRAARNELLLLTDAGCRLDPGFCRNLAGCFSLGDDVDLAGGIYRPLDPAAGRLVPDWATIDWDQFLPSARSIAVRRSLCLQIGGFPEYLPLTGEDTLFDANYRRVSRRWIFNRRSVIAWDAPASDDAVLRLAQRYGAGDGESGLGDYRFAENVTELIRQLPYGAVETDDLVLKGLCLGYLEGRRQRARIELERRGVPAVVLVLSACHVASETNGDARAALDLVRRGYKVVFVNVEPFDGRPRWLDVDVTLLELHGAADFNWEDFLGRYERYADRVFAYYPVYHPVLGALVERLKAKSGNRLPFSTELAALEAQLAPLKPLTPAAEEVAPAALAPGGAGAAQGPTPVSARTQGEPPVSSVPAAASPSVAPGAVSPSAAPGAAAAALESLAASRALAPVAKFWSISRHYGVKEAVRRGRTKLDKLTAPLRSAASAAPQAAARPGPRGEASYDLISFPIMPWASRFQRSQQLLTRFAAHGTRIFRVDRGFLVDEPDVYRHREVHENVVEVTLKASRQLSIYTDAIDAETMERMLRSFEQLRAEWQIASAVCVVELPFWFPIAKALEERYGWKIVYDCMDEHEGFSTNQGATVSNEVALARDAELVVVTSQYLDRKMEKHNRRRALIRNATDFSHFARRPDEDPLRGVPHPIVGYYGAISEWFDQDLLAHAARSLPHCTFVLIGGNDANVSLARLEALPNVRLLGEKPYAELPGYLHAFDVCIIPFKLGKLMEATNPVKFYEYLSAGKPVVSVLLPELFPYREHCYLADGEEDFVAKLRAALDEQDEAVRQARVALAAENTWENRYAAFKASVDAVFPKASIVIVTYNNLELTKLCVDSIYERSQYPLDRFELIIVDNASKDATPAWLRDLAERRSNVKIALNEDNKGFAGGNNQGIAMADGDVVILLNNDTVVTPGWIAKLARYLQEPSVGMVGPATSMCGNESIIHVPYDLATLQGFDTFVSRYAELHPAPEAFEIDMLSMFCVALRRSTVEEIGPLDERFRIGMFEDTDYAERIRRAGLRILSARDVFVHHFCKSSFGKLPNAEYHQIYEENRRKYEEKWGKRSQY